MPDVDLEKLLKRLDAVLSTAPEDAFTMPGEFYTSPAFLELEREQLFRRKWVCLGRAEEIPAAGDYLATELVGEPIILVRTPADEIKALSNVCRHRAMPLLSGTGNCKRITCDSGCWI
jgi:phenylpropionate dioxygenase-like ring-hydroxylating dioxygenase large terminal subunit